MQNSSFFLTQFFFNDLMGHLNFILKAYAW